MLKTRFSHVHNDEGMLRLITVFMGPFCINFTKSITIHIKMLKKRIAHTIETTTSHVPSSMPKNNVFCGTIYIKWTH